MGFFLNKINDFVQPQDSETRTSKNGSDGAFDDIPILGNLLDNDDNYISQVAKTLGNVPILGNLIDSDNNGDGISFDFGPLSFGLSGNLYDGVSGYAALDLGLLSSTFKGGISKTSIDLSGDIGPLSASVSARLDDGLSVHTSGDFGEVSGELSGSIDIPIPKFFSD